MLLGNVTRDFIGKIVPVSWDAALVLRDLDVEFLLLISNENTLCTQLEKALLSFIHHRRLQLYVARVSLTDYPSAATHLGTAYVPQVRFYRDGTEVGRHRGMATYENLRKLMGLPA